MSILFRVAYDGSSFFGWEKQPDRPTVQGTLEATLAAVTGIRARTLAASRTDAGVHAEDQVVAWHTEACRIPLDRLPDVLNRKLPPTVAIRGASSAPPHFDPRRHVRAKTYTYALWVRPDPPDPFWVRRVGVVPGPLNLQILNAAAACFLGRHDFRAFRAEGSSAVTTVRTIWASHWEAEAPVWRYIVTGDGFLYHMVRFLVGSMIKVAADGDLGAIAEALAHPEAPKRIPPAPAAGLTLARVELEGR